MTQPMGEEARRSPLPQHLQREQQALGLILSLISRSLALCVVAAALYLAYLAR